MRLTTKDEKILSLLNNGPLTLEDLDEKMGNQINIRPNLCKLLKSDIIRIKGIASECNSFAQKYLILERSIDDSLNPNVIRDLVMQLGEDQNAYEKIKYLLSRRIEDLESELQPKWDKLLHNLNFRELSEKEMVSLTAERMYRENIKKGTAQGISKDDKLKEIEKKIVEDSDSLSKINSYYQDYRTPELESHNFQRIKIFKKEEIDKVKILESFGFYNPNSSPKAKSDLINKIIFEIEDLVFDVKHTNDDQTTIEGRITIKKFSEALSDNLNSNKKLLELIIELKRYGRY